MVAPFHHDVLHRRVADIGGWPQIYLTSSIGQPTRGSPSALGLGEGLINPHRKKESACYEMSQRITELDGLFGTTKATENGYEIWNMEYQEFL